MAMLAVAASYSAAEAGRWLLTPHIELLETYTDNVDLQPVNKKDDFITRVSPGLHLMGHGARISADIDYTANLLYFAKSSDKTDLRHDLAGSINSELVKDTLFLNAAARINQQYIDRGAAFSTNFDNRTQNRKTVQNYSISPSLKHGFGSWGTAVASYRLNYIRSNADQTLFVPGGVLQDSTTHEASLGFNSGRYFPRLSWGVNADYQYRKRNGGVGSSKRTLVRANASYPVAHWMSLVGSAGYEKINDGTLRRRPKGFIWDAGVTLRPGPRTTLTVRAGRRYNDTTYSVNGQYLFSPRTRFTVSYQDIITNSQDLLAQQLPTGGQLNPPGIPGTNIGSLGDGLGLINSSFRRKRTQASLAGSRGRTSFTVSGYYETRDIDITQEREKNWGATAGINRAIGPHLSGFVSGNFRRTQFQSFGQRTDKLYTANAGFSYTISQHMSAGVQYIMNRRDSSQSQFSIRENAVRINVLATF